MRVERFATAPEGDTGGEACVEHVAADVFAVLARQLAEIATVPDTDFPFAGGLVGWFGYELEADLGMPGSYRAATPDADWLFVDRLLALDHDTGRAELLALVPDDVSARRAASDWLASAATTCATAGPSAAEPADKCDAEGGSPDPASIERLLTRSRPDYLAAVRAATAALQAGDSYEICLTDTVRLPFTGTAYELYRALRQANPAPYAAFLDIGDVQVLSAPPKRFLHVDPTGRIETRPIKGTAARLRDPALAAAAAQALSCDPKTVAENIVVVDLLRNDLHRVCEPGSVGTPRLLEVETYPSVHQLVSTVEGVLRDGLGVLDAVRACFPGGSMTGAPKRRTCEIIDELETCARGVYSGALGYLAGSGAADLAIVIRTAVVHDGEVSVGAGGGIVLDSDPEAEYAEMALKAAATLRVVRSVDALAAGGAANPTTPARGAPEQPDRPDATSPPTS